MADRLPIRGVDLFQKTTRFSRSRLERRVHRDANDVIPWWHYLLPIAAVENKVLAPEEETVGIGPAVADPLISGNADRPATPKLRALRRLSARGSGSGICIQHAEAFFGCLPNEPGRGIDQLILGIVPEMIMMVALGKLEQTIIGGNVNVRITDNDVRIAYVRCFHSKADDSPESGCNTAFLNAAGGRIQLLIADYPLMAKKVAVHKQSVQTCRS